MSEVNPRLCWRCATWPIATETGLCTGCRELLRDPAYVREFHNPAPPDGPSPLTQAYRDRG